MCFNAADHYRMGWYSSKRRDVGSGPWTGKVGAFVYSQSSSNPVVIKASGNIYFQYNLAQAHNSGTRAMSNQLVIVKLLSNGHTEVQRGLNQGETWSGAGLRIQVCSQGAREVSVAVNSNCGSAAVSGGGGSSSSNWGNNNAWQSGPSPSSSFNLFAPRPAPSFSVNVPRPSPSFTIRLPGTPSVGWNSPSISNVFNSLFSFPKPSPTTNSWSSWTTTARSAPAPSSSTWNTAWAGAEVADP